VCSGQPDGYCAAKAEQQANAYILENHSAAEGSHAIRITQDHVMACAAREYDIRGDADHSHVFTLFEGHFGLLDVGGSIELDSTEANGHTHVLWADCE
jgi:hypothetical protein